MGRREILNGLFGVIAAAGAAALIGATAADEAYRPALIWGGAAALAVGVLGIAVLLLTKPKVQSPETQPTTSITSHNQSGGITAHTVNKGDQK